MLFFIFYLISELKFPHKKEKKQIETADIRAADMVYQDTINLAKISRPYIKIADESRSLFSNEFPKNSKGKSLSEWWITTFLPDRQQPLIFVRFISNFLCMCSVSMASAYVILK